MKRMNELPDPEVTRWDIERIEDGIELREDSNGRVLILNEPEDGWDFRYSISADVSEGLEKGDNSVMYVHDRHLEKDVASFSGKVDTTIFAYLLSYFGFKYNEAYIAVENNGHGHAVLQKLKEIYENLYHMEDFSREIDLEKTQLGWNTNLVSRPIMCGELRNVINLGKEAVFDKQFYQECMTFIYNRNGKPEADKGCLDDRVITQAIKWQIHKWLPAPSINVQKKEQKYDQPRFGGVEVENKKDIRTIWR
jgi:hypothetical protein